MTKDLEKHRRVPKITNSLSQQRTEPLEEVGEINGCISKRWVEEFSEMSYEILTKWIEEHDPVEEGYLEAIHVLWCRLCVNNVMRGQIQPRDVPMIQNLENYFSQ